MSQYFDNDKNIKSERKIIKFNFDNKDFSIYSDNGVFSKDRFDYGTRVLLNSVDVDKLFGNVLDLGCGLGVVGIILGTFNKGINIDMVDINERAINLAKHRKPPKSDLHFLRWTGYVQPLFKTNKIFTFMLNYS